MKIKGFLKLLNRKINKYDKAASNPFEATPLTITLVWVENDAQAGMKSEFDVFRRRRKRDVKLKTNSTIPPL